MLEVCPNWLHQANLLLEYVPVSFFPLLVGLLDPSSPELGQQLELLKQPDLLWTPYGLR